MDLHIFSMRYLILGLAAFATLTMPATSMAWDGFDADSTDLVEIIPDKIPRPGNTIDVRNYESDTTRTCLVESVIRNPRTIEVMVRDPNGKRHTLVMEGR